MSLIKKGFFKVGFFAYIQTIKTQKIREKKESLILQFAMNFKLKYLFQINYYFKSIILCILFQINCYIIDLLTNANLLIFKSFYLSDVLVSRIRTMSLVPARARIPVILTHVVRGRCV